MWETGEWLCLVLLTVLFLMVNEYIGLVVPFTGLLQFVLNESASLVR